jgi:multidrug efflux pump subunit AcrA (membrane-fusion protein)
VSIERAAGVGFDGGWMIKLAGQTTIIAVAIATIALVSPARAAGSVSEAPQVTVVRAVSACFAATVRATGFLVPREEAIVSGVPGSKVVEILVQEGDRVKLGQVLARLTRERVDPQGPAAVGGGNVDLKAPAAGLITSSTAVVGGVVSAAAPEPLFRIAVGNEIELQVQVSSIHVPELQPGQVTQVQIEDGRALIGHVRLAPAAVDARTQLGQARISLESGLSLRIGMFGSAMINTSRSCGVSVPTSAIVYGTEGTRVHIVRDDRIQTVVVQVGLSSDTATEIRSGVSDGDMVVANAGGSLQDGDTVKPIFIGDTQMGGR